MSFFESAVERASDVDQYGGGRDLERCDFGASVPAEIGFGPRSKNDVAYVVNANVLFILLGIIRT